MIGLLKTYLLENNFLQLIQENTRTVKILDHIYYNNINKLHHRYTEPSSTDHKIIVIEKKMKVSQLEERFCYTRKWKQINYERMEKNIIDSDIYRTMLEDDDLERITINLIKLIQNQYNLEAPVIKVKIKDKNNDILSKETKELIEKKNIAYKELKAQSTSESDDISQMTDLQRNFKILSSLCKKKCY